MKRVPLRRRNNTLLRTSPILRKPRLHSRPRADDDKVTPEIHAKVLARDGRCMAPVLDRDLKTLCADTFGNELAHGSWAARQSLHLDHVPDENATAMGSRAPSDAGHLIAICPRHHLLGWATSKHGRGLEREYLAKMRAVDERQLPDSMER